MHYHILLTETCNSRCRYCFQKSMKEEDNGLGKKFKFDFSAPEASEVDVKKLRNFLAQDSEPVLIFYGGEPLLEIEKIEKIIDNLKDRGIKFRMQTNGKLLDQLPAKYMNAIGKLLISLDGDRERTDYQKGQGTYDLVMNNIKLIRENGFQGEIVARVTVSEFPDIYKQVLSLVNAGFSSIHWQLDAGFYKFDFDEAKFSKFVENYNKEIDKLINFWINDMRTNNRVLMLYPFVGIINNLLHNKTTKLMCGAGYAGYAITTNGKIVACPIMNCITDFEAGTLEDSPEKLKKFDIRHEECGKCSYFGLCGGRCLYWRESGLWPKEGDELICKTVKHLIDELGKRVPEIRELIDNRTVKMRDFDYEKYFGPEIIP
jgi:uncharacterized protein